MSVGDMPGAQARLMLVQTDTDLIEAGEDS